MINLLPITEKEKIQSHLFKKQINNFVLLVSAIFLGSGIFMLNTYVFLKIQTGSLNQSLNMEEIKSDTKEVKNIESGIENLNSNLGSYQDFRLQRTPVLNVFLKLKDVIPAGAKLTSLLFDGNSKKIVISGTASSRDDVITIEDRLKRSDFFEKIDSPLNNFLDSSNAKFNFTFYVK